MSFKQRGSVHGARTVKTSPVQMSVKDNIVSVNLTTPGACTVNGAPGRKASSDPYTIKDGAGNASVHAITYYPSSGLIDGMASIQIQQNYDSLTIFSDGTNEFTM